MAELLSGAVETVGHLPQHAVCVPVVGRLRESAAAVGLLPQSLAVSF